MEAVAAGFGHGVDSGGGVLSILSGQRAGLDFKLLHRVRKREGHRLIAKGVVVGRSIKQEGYPVRQTARYADNYGWVVLCRIQIARRRGRGCSPEKNQHEIVPAIQRQINDALLIYNLSNACAMGFDHGGIRRDLDLFRYRTNLQRGVNSGIAVNLQNNSRLDIFAEAFLADFERPGTDRKIRQGKSPVDSRW